MDDVVLLVFEGQKPEKIVIDSLSKFFMQDIKEKCELVFYESDIYYLYDKIASDPFLDFYELLKEHNPNENLNRFSSEDVSQIFLFFDYDLHATRVSDQKVEKLLEMFDNETENGKLYLSYPMSEAIVDYKLINCENCTINKHDSVKFKKIVNDKNLNNNIKKFTYDDFKDLINSNLSKANCLIDNGRHCKKPPYRTFLELNQKFIHKNQKELLSTENIMMILSAFPFFILEYLNESYYNKV